MHSYLGGTHENVIKFIVNDEDAFSKIQSAKLKLFSGAPTKRCAIESNFPSPSDNGKKPCHASVRDHRYSSGLHTSLQIQAFGHFLDVMRKADCEIDSKYHEAAGLLLNKMRKEYSNEMARQQAFADAVMFLFPPFLPMSKGRARSDYTTTVKIGEEVYAIINWEFKNEMCNISSDPNKQGIAYFVHLRSGETGRSPMLLVSVVGCYYFEVFGAVWNGNHICIDPLSGPISLLPVPRDPKYGVEKVACVLAALSSTLDALMEYYNNPDEHNKGPYFRSCSLGRLQNMKMLNVEWVFEANCAGKEVVVKFVRKYYGQAVHNLLARKKLAPQLFSVDPLPGGWLAVVMEKVVGEMMPRKITKPVKVALEKAVGLMHSNGYVHGDLRPQNILVVGNTISILDFDWAGKYPDARYSSQLNKTCDWHPNVVCGGIIDTEHDQYQIDQFEVL